MPERDAQDILARIRSGTDIETVLSHVATGNLLLQLSVVPESRYRYKFPYISKMPTNLLTDDNLYKRPLIYEGEAIYPSSDEQGIVGEDARMEGARMEGAAPAPAPPSHMEGADPSEHETIYLKPFHAAEVIDPLLESVKPSLWTSVHSDDALMRKLLSLYFLHEYPHFTAFQKECFLEAMAAQRENLCSSLLVNAILAFSCVSAIPRALYASL